MTSRIVHRTSFPSRLRALIRKEFNQIRRDRRLAMSLIVPPTLQLLLFGFALNSTVSDLRLGVIDDSRTPESRELQAVMTESKSFRLAGSYASINQLGDAISRGNLDAGLVIPYDYARNLQRGRQTDVQILLNAVNANTAAIGQGYAQGVIQSYNRNLLQNGGIHAEFRQIAANDVSRRGQVKLQPAFLFNPGLVNSWFIATGTFGVLLILNGSLVASAAMIKERERGTVEQLLMTPSGTAEIIIAKIAPLFGLLLFMVLFATFLLRVAFGVPFRGSFLLVFSGAALCVLCGIGIGTFIATVTKSAQQTQLMSFFVNPPLASLSGALTPVEAMPHWMQPLTVLNPIRHFGVITRGALLKGSGLAELWPNLLALLLFTLVLLSLSVWRFRKQLG
jgi:ABC-2 type transport system permease protein